VKFIWLNGCFTSSAIIIRRRLPRRPLSLLSVIVVCCRLHGRQKRGYAGDMTPQIFMWGTLICISLIKTQYLGPSHANCMQHVYSIPRCWERQSGGSEYKKPFSGRGSAPDPAEGAYSTPTNPLVGGDGLAVPSPRTPSHRSRPLTSSSVIDKYYLKPIK